MHRTVVFNVVGLTPSLLGTPATPNLNSLLRSSVPVRPVTPAVTCSVQASYLTGKMPAEHGIVGNGWYFREQGEVHFWRQSNKLVQGEKIWHKARRRSSAFTVCNTFWWYAMNSDVDWTLTPRPLYCADGRKIPDCYTVPLELRDRFNRDFGRFPLFRFWGPATSIASSEWIGKAAMAMEMEFQPSLQLVYLPHLDYGLQRVGPDGNVAGDLQQIDALCGTLLAFFRNRGCRILVLSEYGITSVNRVVHPNRILRKAGLLSLKTDLGKEYLDPCTSRAFAVADHQLAHIYVRQPKEVMAVKEIFSSIPGVEVMGKEEKKEIGLDHERAGEIVLLAQADRWFSYYWWLDDSKAPDYARTVNIHVKPGYDPCELFIDSRIPFPGLKIACFQAKKALGFRSPLNIVPLDASLVKGSHGRMPENSSGGPLLMTSDPRLLDSDSLQATEVHNLLLRHLFED
ncbi:MAG: alkaline phosphatase family protein [Syntrophotaleaceae bacterium]